jgi:hypothetical protein
VEKAQLKMVSMSALMAHWLFCYYPPPFFFVTPGRVRNVVYCCSQLLLFENVRKVDNARICSECTMSDIPLLPRELQFWCVGCFQLAHLFLHVSRSFLLPFLAIIVIAVVRLLRCNSSSPMKRSTLNFSVLCENGFGIPNYCFSPHVSSFPSSYSSVLPMTRIRIFREGRKDKCTGE